VQINDKLLKKLKEMFERHNELEKHLSDPEVISNNTRYTSYVKEHGRLSKFVTKYLQLDKTLKQKEDAKNILAENNGDKDFGHAYDFFKSMQKFMVGRENRQDLINTQGRDLDSDSISRMLSNAVTDNIEAVQRIAGNTIMRAMEDLTPLSKELLLAIHNLVQKKYESLRNAYKEAELWHVIFTRKELLEKVQWSLYHIKQHLEPLVEHGYITPKFGRKGQRFAYCLVSEDKGIT